MTEPSSRYVLATGDEGAYRLAVVNGVHGPDTHAFLRRAGLAPGMSVADIGCGIGRVTVHVAAEVGPAGYVVGLDASEGQVVQARSAAEKAGLANVTIVHAGAHDTGLPRASFDLVFSRLMLMHVPRPAEAVAEMAALVKPGGTLAVEDGDFRSPFCEPHSPAYDRCFELYRAVVAGQGADPLVGHKLYAMVLDAGLPAPEVALVQPVCTRGDMKRLPEWTLEEVRDRVTDAGLADAAEVDAILSEMAELAADPRTMFGMAQMTQVWARKPLG